MIIDIRRKVIISENLSFFENHLAGMASRHFFVEAVRCSEPQPAFYLAGVTCLLHGIEGALSQAIYEVREQAKLSEDHAMDRGEHKNFNNQALRSALTLGFDIETLAFPDEQGEMRMRVKQNEPVGIVQFRNEFSHGKVFRATETIGHELISDTVFLAPHFKDLLTLSYGFVVEVERFMGHDCGVSTPDNPCDY